MRSSLDLNLENKAMSSESNKKSDCFKKSSIFLMDSLNSLDVTVGSICSLISLLLRSNGWSALPLIPHSAPTRLMLDWSIASLVAPAGIIMSLWYIVLGLILVSLLLGRKSFL